MAHKHAEVLHAIAEEKPVQFRILNHGDSSYHKWNLWNESFYNPLDYIPRQDSWEWRVKPDTVFVNGIELPKPKVHIGQLATPRQAVVITMLSEGIGLLTETVLLTESEKETKDLYNAIVIPFQK